LPLPRKKREGADLKKLYAVSFFSKYGWLPSRQRWGSGQRLYSGNLVFIHVVLMPWHKKRGGSDWKIGTRSAFSNKILCHYCCWRVKRRYSGNQEFIHVVLMPDKKGVNLNWKIRTLSAFSKYGWILCSYSWVVGQRRYSGNQVFVLCVQLPWKNRGGSEMENS
jgi:hypothetical protein